MVVRNDSDDFDEKGSMNVMSQNRSMQGNGDVYWDVKQKRVQEQKWVQEREQGLVTVVRYHVVVDR